MLLSENKLLLMTDEKSPARISHRLLVINRSEMRINMELTLNGIKDTAAWAGCSLPSYDIEQMRRETSANPVWLHFGSGNIFRAFIAAAAQRLLNQGDASTGIICAESTFGTEIITECYRPHDNLCVSVTLNPDGSIDKEVIGSVAESVTIADDMDRITDIFCSPSLQLVSFTITEKGYAIKDSSGNLTEVIKKDMENTPEKCTHLMSLLAALCIRRFHTCGRPLALVSMDNCSHNGEKLESAITTIASAWKENGFITQDELDYLKTSVSYPWSMIDKITPRPDAQVEASLAADGIKDINAFVTPGGVYVAPFVNAEKPEYLVIEDDFPNGRPALHKAGILFTDRDTVNKVEKMKVCTCLNPLHTCLAIYGCLLGYTSIASEMNNPQLKSFITKMAYEEGMPVVINPGIIDPKTFLNEVLTKRLPNPFMPDTPQRIATDTSQKLPIRFGETIKLHLERRTAGNLKYIPLVLAGWLRYLLAVDDNGDEFTPSSDPLLDECQAVLSGIALKDQVDSTRLHPLLSNSNIFGVDLEAAGLAGKVTDYFNELIAGKGAVLATLKKYTA